MSQLSDQPNAQPEGLDAILAESSFRSRIVSQAKECWAQRPPDAKAFLAEHPEIGPRKSIVLDLAYEEYCQRIEAGEAIDADEYCRRFSEHERSLGRLIAVHGYLEENASLLSSVDVDWPEPEEEFLGFSLLAELGRGAFARVFLAEETALGDRLVAIKVGKDGAAEAVFLGQLQHANIVPVNSVREDAGSGLTVVCMPYLGRDTLCDVLDGLFAGEGKPTKSGEILKTLSVEAHGLPAGGDDTRRTDPKLRRGSYVDGVVHLGAQMADALAYSHSKGICHSDLKPSNILITPDGRPMLLDFNLAFDPAAVDRRLGGTLPYMSPEQLRAVADPSALERSPMDERSDIFSLGVILHEMLTGVLPFGPLPTEGSNHQIKAHLLKRRKSGPFSLRDGKNGVDTVLAELVQGCLAFDAEDRPDSAQAVAAALWRSISPAQRTRRWIGRHRWPVGSLTASFLLVILGIAVHFVTRGSFADRQFNIGLVHYRQGEYLQAEEYFTLSIESSERRARAFFWRARSRQKAGKILQALQDYQEAARLSSAPEISACQAYCWGLERDAAAVTLFSNRAIDAGFGTAEVYNNLGASNLRDGQLESALVALNEAIRQDESLQTALCNRALVEFRRALRDRRPVDSRAGSDIDAAIDAGPPTGWMYLDAALIYSKLEQEPGEYRKEIVRYVCEALRLGARADTVRKDFESLLDDPEIAASLANYGPGEERRESEHLVDPLRTDSFDLPR